MFRLKVKEVAQEKGMSQRQLFLRSGVDITDRKSTRLNSSHLGISYAVFCLPTCVARWSPEDVRVNGLAG